MGATREYHREYKRRMRLRPEIRREESTRNRSRYLKRTGVLVPEPCLTCEAPATETEMHHPDLDDAERVVWLCPPCHRGVHKAIRVFGALVFHVEHRAAS